MKDETKVNHFQQEINRELNSRPCVEQIEKEWSQIETVMIDVTNRILGSPKGRKKDKWFDEQCKQALEKRNKIRQRLLEENSEENRLEYKKQGKKLNKYAERTKEITLKGN